MSKKTILVVSHHLEKGGGASRSANIIAQGLSKKHNVKILTIHETINSFNTTLFQDDLKIPKTGALLYYKNIYNSTDKIKKFLAEQKIDTIITNSVGSEIPFLLLKEKGIPQKIIVCVRSSPDRLFANPLKKTVMKQLYKYADKIVVSTKASAEELKNMGLNNVITIPNFFDIKDLIKQTKEKIDLVKGFKYVTISRLDKLKRIDLIIKAMKHINGALYIVGDGPEKENLERLTKKLGIEEKIIFTGKQYNVMKYLKNCDCFILASKSEGFGNVIVEAMTAGIPIITTDCPNGPKEILSPENALKQIDYPLVTPQGIIISNKGDIAELEKTMQFMRCIKHDTCDRINEYDTKKVIGEWEKII